MKLTIYLFGIVSLSLLPLICKAGGSFSDLHATSPEKSVTTTLFEWRFDDIAAECERFLGPVGYAAVLISPVLEYAVVPDRPWHERYQPVSYKIASRSGDEAGFTDMIQRCNKAGVRVIVDIELNHMTSPVDGVGVGGTEFKGTTKSYPGVPYDSSHFTPREKCPQQDGKVHDYDNVPEVRNCNLFGLQDLDTTSDYVKSKLREAVNKLIDLGVAGFRIDAAKHMLPNDIEAIFNSAHDLNETYFPSGSKPLLIHEVLLGGKVPMSDYTPIGRVLEFGFRKSLTEAFLGRNNQKLKWLKNFGEEWSLSKSNDAISMVDNQDVQRDEVTTGISFRNPRSLKLASAYMLAWPYGIPNIMSSYNWTLNMDGDVDKNAWMGPPSDDKGNIQNVVIKNDECQEPWVCEHRFKPIANMVKFRNIAGDEPVTDWWDNGNNAIAFGRGPKGFVVINNEPSVLSQTFKTGLPEGTYCDIISGDIKGDQCTGKTFEIGPNGEVNVTIDGANDEIPMVAFHIVPEPTPTEEPMETTTEMAVTTETIAVIEEPRVSEPEVDQCENDKRILDACALCRQSMMNRKVEL